MLKSLLRFLGGEEGEEKSMLLLLGKGFFMGIMIATYRVGAEALFIDKVGEDRLSEAFFLMGGAGIFFTSFFVFLQRNINYSSLVRIMTFLTLIILVGLRTAFYIIGNDEESEFLEQLVFTLYIMSGPIMAVTLLGFWGIFGRIFDLRQTEGE